MTAFKRASQSLGSRKVALGLLTANGVLSPAGLAIHSTPEQFKTTLRFVGRLNGETFGKAATTALTFTAAHVVTASKFAVILVQITPTGTVSTKVPGATQAYDTAALALAALPTADAGNVAMGYIAIAAKAATWTANTDDMTAASDLTSATFTDYPALTFTT
ncbi:MAG: hypothetical protein JWM95_1697 [Gemmatimonadetes bacterium]|nr:hypothetical protein [Gemmatimonadota bacterium]